VRDLLHKIFGGMVDESSLDDLLLRKWSDILAHLNDFTHEGAVEVTLFPTYGYKQTKYKWTIPLSAWVHQRRKRFPEVAAKVVAKMLGCHGDSALTTSRIEGFVSDSRSHQTISVAFGSDPGRQTFAFKSASDFNGRIEMDLELGSAEAREILERQSASDGWLTLKVVSDGHTGEGRVKLIEPEGISVISDIDDTIKDTRIPLGKDAVLRRTFCEPFAAFPDMTELYQEQGNVCFHYVSGGPHQMLKPLKDFFFNGAGFPEGTFHLVFFGKNLLDAGTTKARAEDFLDALSHALDLENSIDRTYTHKVQRITEIMDRFRGRKFILVGDSGEVDPEVYRHIQETHADQVEKVIIRDLINYREIDSKRFTGMDLREVQSSLTLSKEYREKLSNRIKSLPK
jgi:uncharacterized protein DUF2183